MVERADFLTLTAPETTAPLGGMRAQNNDLWNDLPARRQAINQEAGPPRGQATAAQDGSASSSRWIHPPPCSEFLTRTHSPRMP